MWRATVSLIAVASLCAGVAHPQAPARLQIVETDPPAGSRLKPGEAFYARVLYESDREIRIWGRGKGAALMPGKSHPSPAYGPGRGEALVWFTLDVAGKIEAMRIEAVPPGSDAAVSVLEVPVRLEWANDAPARTRASWVEPMAADLQGQVQQRTFVPSGSGWDALVMLLFACVLGYPLAQGFAFWRMRRRYGFAFWLPVGAMALVYLVALLGALAGSNLAPIWVVFTSPVALIYVIVLLSFDFWRTSHASGTHR
jgi:hypothetical protein